MFIFSEKLWEKYLSIAMLFSNPKSQEGLPQSVPYFSNQFTSVVHTTITNDLRVQNMYKIALVEN